MAQYLPYIIFAIGLAGVIFGSTWFVSSAAKLAKMMGVSQLIIGATIVSVGTTLPELSSSMAAAIRGNTAFALGNALGSINCNTGLILGLLLLSGGVVAGRGKLFASESVYLLALIVVLYAVSLNNVIGRVEGLFLLASFILYLMLNLKRALKSRLADNDRDADYRTATKAGIVLKLIAGSLLLGAGAFILVEKGIEIAGLLGLPDYIISLTFVALGTSLPELATAIAALVRRQYELSAGNIIGANILNVALVVGASATVRPLDVPASMLTFDFAFVFLFVILMVLAGAVSFRRKRYPGGVFLLLYIAYVAQLLLRG